MTGTRNPFSKEVRKALINAGLTIAETARRMQAHPTYLYRILEQQRDVPRDFLLRLEGVGVEVNWAMRVEYARARGVMPLDGLSSEQVSELMQMVEVYRVGA